MLVFRCKKEEMRGGLCMKFLYKSASICPISEEIIN
jgi:hypothetical protein